MASSTQRRSKRSKQTNKRSVEDIRFSMFTHRSQYRLTIETTDYLVLGVILERSLPADETGPTTIADIAAGVEKLERWEAGLYERAVDPVVWQIDQIPLVIDDFITRGVISKRESEVSGAFHFTPLFSLWNRLPSVRIDHKGEVWPNES